MRNKLLLTGATGFLGRYIRELALAQGSEVISVSRSGDGTPGEITHDLQRPECAAALLAEVRPDRVLHAGAIASIAGCQADPAISHRVNVESTASLAESAARLGIPFLFTSTDQVFAGNEAPYAPDASPAPLSLYGETKAAAEERVKAAGGDWRIARIALLFGRSALGTKGASDSLLHGLATGRGGVLFNDEFRSPLAVDEAAKALLAFLAGPSGKVWNLAGPERMSRYQFGCLVAQSRGQDPAPLGQGSRGDNPEFAGRPADLTLDISATQDFLGGILSPPEISLQRIYGGGA